MYRQPQIDCITTTIYKLDQRQIGSLRYYHILIIITIVASLITIAIAIRLEHRETLTTVDVASYAVQPVGRHVVCYDQPYGFATNELLVFFFRPVQKSGLHVAQRHVHFARRQRSDRGNDNVFHH